VFEAVDLMRARPAHAWTAAELAAASSTSVRSLQENFRRSLGTSPMRYLRDFRLEQVHKELLDYLALIHRPALGMRVIRRK
jgi:transcriptional regulator GlxA family with amidase domain